MVGEGGRKEGRLSARLCVWAGGGGRFSVCVSVSTLHIFKICMSLFQSASTCERPKVLVILFSLFLTGNPAASRLEGRVAWGQRRPEMKDGNESEVSMQVGKKGRGK